MEGSFGTEADGSDRLRKAGHQKETRNEVVQKFKTLIQNSPVNWAAVD